MRHSQEDSWGRYKEIALLLVGGIIGIASSYVTSTQQLSAQKQQFLFDQRFRVIREFVELNSSTWQKIDIPLAALDRKLEVAHETLLKKPASESLGPYLAKTMGTLGDSLEEISKTLADESREYDAKLDVTLTLLGYLSSERPHDVAIDVEMSHMTPDLLKANQDLDAAIAAGSTREQSIKIAEFWIESVRSAIKRQRERNTDERQKINRAIQGLAERALK